VGPVHPAIVTAAAKKAKNFVFLKLIILILLIKVDVEGNLTILLLKPIVNRVTAPKIRDEEIETQKRLDG